MPSHDVVMRSPRLLLICLLAGLPLVGQAAALQPFVATYDAWYEGKHAGEATMQLVQRENAGWR
ncbi:hypothetical protein, partial [Bacillus sp. SIMBA_005]|uniref:hypothetical protein n=1 Tax=Bacillus sp. SIMBA_005 TaxID=3085754 RepID=UPI003977E6E8